MSTITYGQRLADESHKIAHCIMDMPNVRVEVLGINRVSATDETTGESVTLCISFTDSGRPCYDEPAETITSFALRDRIREHLRGYVQFDPSIPTTHDRITRETNDVFHHIRRSLVSVILMERLDFRTIRFTHGEANMDIQICLDGTVVKWRRSHGIQPDVILKLRTTILRGFIEEAK